MPVIPAPWGAEACGSQSQEIKTILTNTVKRHLYKKLAEWWHVPVVPATWEAGKSEGGGVAVSQDHTTALQPG